MTERKPLKKSTIKMADSSLKIPLGNSEEVKTISIESKENLTMDSIEEQESVAEAKLSQEEHRRQLIEELDQLIENLRILQAEYPPPSNSSKQQSDQKEMRSNQFSPGMSLTVLQRMRNTINEDILDMDTWRGIWYMVNYSLESQRDLLRRRMAGDYQVDEWGYDEEVLQTVAPFFTFMYKTYWRIQTNGMEKIPGEGRTLLVCNHSGQLPWDGAMLGTAIYNEHPNQRLVRTLLASWFPTLPFFSMMFTKLGQVLATEENGIRLLEQEQLVSVFPEGIKGVSKTYWDRYRLARFGRGGFVRMALKTSTPMIPVSIVGAEETYISLFKVPIIAKMIGFPFFPISITWPWTGPFGFVPIPTKWYIDFGDPIPTVEYGPGAENNLVLVSQLTDQVRNVVQDMIWSRLVKRKSVIYG